MLLLCSGLSVSLTDNPEQSESTLLLELSKYVTSRGLRGLTTVLIVDEAHNLSIEYWRKFVSLSTMTSLFSIRAVGQPELDLKLDSFELRPLKQELRYAHISHRSMNRIQTSTSWSDYCRVNGPNRAAVLDGGGEGNPSIHEGFRD